MFNIDIAEDNSNRPGDKILLKHYFSSLFVYGIVLLILHFNKEFVSRMSVNIFSGFTLMNAYDYAYLFYIFGALIIYFLVRPTSVYQSHNIQIVEYIKRVFLHLPKLKNFTADEINAELQYYKPSYEEGQALMRLFIKVFFGTLMLSGLFNNIGVISSNAGIYKNISTQFHTAIGSLSGVFGVINQHKVFLYETFILFMFTIDLAIFSFGYCTELSCLKNKIRMVETTPFGVFVCLLCYYPFVLATTNFLGWNQADNVVAFGDINHPITWVFRIAALFFLVIYVWASIALGTKASNLTNRGTVTKFPYSVVRHPAYISKNIFWMLTTFPMFLGNFELKKFILVTLSFLAWASIYYFRALAEERLLIKDPEYQEYIEKVKYRFIPGVI